MREGMTQGLRARLKNSVMSSLVCVALIWMPCVLAAGQASAALVSSSRIPPSVRKGESNSPQRANQDQPKKSAIDRRIEILTKELNLNEVQRFDTRTILDHGQAESQKLWANQQIAPIDRMLKLRTIRDDAQKQFQALLTGEQRRKYQAYLQRQGETSASAQAGSASYASEPAQSSTSAAH